MKSLINLIKKKKELADVPDSFIEEIVKKKFPKNEELQGLNKKELKTIIKEVRSELRKHTGMFQSSYSLEKMKRILENGDMEKFLKTHKSTSERVESYSELFQVISEISPKSILDLCCGINPIPISSKNKDITYYAYDIQNKNIILINYFFKKNIIKGKAFLKDVLKIKKFPTTDLCLILKSLDILSKQENFSLEKLFKKIKSPNMIVSFSTKTLSGKKMKQVRRKKFEKIFIELNYKYNIWKTPNEIFYIIKRTK